MGRGGKKGVPLLLIFILSTMEIVSGAKKGPLRSRFQFNLDFTKLLGFFQVM